MVNERPKSEPLESLAKRIVRCANEADEKVLEAVRLIREARERVEAREAGDIRWYTWAKEHIKLSKSRLRELLRISEADDPKKELERLRAQTRERVERHRARAKQAATTNPKTSAPLRNGGTGAKVVSEAVDAHAAPRTWPDPGAKPEPDRERLIAWARSAPSAQVAKVLSYIEGLVGTTAGTDIDRAANSAAAA